MSDRGSHALTFAIGAVAGACTAGAVALALRQSGTATVKQEKRGTDVVSSTSANSAPVHENGTAKVKKQEEPERQMAAAAATPEKPADAPEACPGTSSDNAGKSSACAGCPNQGLCSSGKAKEVDPAVAEVKSRLANVKRKILVLSGKGGVGKSTISAQISFMFASRNMDVGLLDIDITGPSVPRMLGLLGQDVHQSSEGWSPIYVDDRLAVMSIGFMLPDQDDAIIWRGPRKNGLIKQFLTDVNWGALDVLVVDTPPGTSDEHLSIVQYLKDSGMDGAVIVTTPQEVSLMDVRKEINFCRKVGIPIIGVIENMSGHVCPKCGHENAVFQASTGGAESMCNTLGIPFLGKVPLDGRVASAGDAGLPITQLQPEGTVAKCIDSVVGAILKHTGTQSL
eukprot:gnl/TRDRNA2_/TRDRNA2_39425_c0_seq1.p1 gnl/TRDRNA2_/TRDRNA2_39425_c0~~gnl/TRDRNA2_/TRDRNA2_39425_c0_seq1.p1  ORF type:complete len:396 (+),score=72.02 gnl/TRDRNA2_/TRDRNA2_39425_c0_seq1:55-1242(+)